MKSKIHEHRNLKIKLVSKKLTQDDHNKAQLRIFAIGRVEKELRDQLQKLKLEKEQNVEIIMSFIKQKQKK